MAPTSCLAEWLGQEKGTLMRHVIAGLLGAAVLVGSPARADFVVDQSNDHIASPTSPTLAIGAAEQKLAQTFVVGMSGQLAKLRLPLACGTGTLLIDIVAQSADDLPTGRLLRRTPVPAEALPGEVTRTFVDIFLISPLAVTAGDRLAIVLSNPTGSCGLLRAELGDTYPSGAAYFDARPNPPGWLSKQEFPGEPWDLPFQTMMEVPDDPCATINGVPISGDLPICRCLRDEGLREFRCAFFDPAFLAIRRTPWPIALGKPYVETWEVLPLTQLRDAIKVRLEGANIPQPIDLTFTGKSRKALDSRKVMLQAPPAAGAVAGTAVVTYGKRSFKIDTSVLAEQFGGVKAPPKVP